MVSIVMRKCNKVTAFIGGIVTGMCIVYLAFMRPEPNLANGVPSINASNQCTCAARAISKMAMMMIIRNKMLFTDDNQNMDKFCAGVCF